MLECIRSELRKSEKIYTIFSKKLGVWVIHECALYSS